MTLPLSSPFTDGTFVNKGQLDQLVTAINLLNTLLVTGSTHATFKNTSGQSIPTSTYTTVTGWSVFESTGMGTYSAGVQTILTAGVYVTVGAVSYPPNAAGAGQRVVRLVFNGATTVHEFSQRPDTAFNVSLPFSHAEYLHTGDTLSVQTYQSQGSSQALATGDGLVHWAIAYTGS